MKFIQAINPATDELIKEYEAMDKSEIESILQKSKQAFLEWQKIDYSDRARLMRQLAKNLRAHCDAHAHLMAIEMGKTLKEGKAEIEKCAWTAEYFADHAADFLKPVVIATEAKKSFVTYQPLGVVFGIMPWNFPFWQVFRFAIPALMAGNAGVLKHASNVPGCALTIEKVFQQAGFPENIFRTLLIGSDAVSTVIENPCIAAVTLTGSTKAGKAVAAKAGQQLKKTVLELGGSDPYIILPDADLAKAVEVCVMARLLNSGQSCIAAKRFIVIESMQQQFEQLFVAKMQQSVMGDPLKPETTIGPQARIDLRDELHQQVLKSIALGAKCLLGGKIPEGKGAYYPATVLTNVKKGMPAFDEELFGPVAAIITAKSEAEAIQLANDSHYGLGAAVFTTDLKKGEMIAAQHIQSGSCFVNAQVRSDPRLPFGGIKESGYGRELSYFGIKEFVNIKTVYIRM